MITEQVVRNFEGFIIYGIPIHLEISLGKNCVIYISNLRKQWNCKTVVELITNSLSNVVNVTALEDPKGLGRNRGYCFVRFNTQLNAENALSLINSDDFKIGGIKVIGKWASSQVDSSDERSLNVFLKI